MNDVRLADGRIIPELGVCLRGRRELARLKAEGVRVDLDAIDVWELGRAAILADPPPPELTEEQRLLLAQIEARNQVELHAWRSGRIRLATPEELEQARAEHEATLPPKRQQELALVRRHNSAIASGDDRYAGLYLDQRLALGEEILHLDPLPQGGGGGQGPELMTSPQVDQETAPELHPEIAEENSTDQTSGIEDGQGRPRRRQRRRISNVRSVSYVDPGRKNPMYDDDDD